MSSRVLFAIFVAIIVAGSLCIIVSHSYGTDAAIAAAPSQTSPPLASGDNSAGVEWSVLGVVGAGLAIFLLRPRRRAVQGRQ